MLRGLEQLDVLLDLEFGFGLKQFLLPVGIRDRFDNDRLRFLWQVALDQVGFEVEEFLPSFMSMTSASGFSPVFEPGLQRGVECFHLAFSFRRLGLVTGLDGVEFGLDGF